MELVTVVLDNGVWRVEEDPVLVPGEDVTVMEDVEGVAKPPEPLPVSYRGRFVQVPVRRSTISSDLGYVLQSDLPRGES